jgi:hypothetical protein
MPVAAWRGVAEIRAICLFQIQQIAMFWRGSGKFMGSKDWRINQLYICNYLKKYVSFNMNRAHCHGFDTFRQSSGLSLP